jgi:hypothetical protein
MLVTGYGAAKNTTFSNNFLDGVGYLFVQTIYLLYFLTIIGIC